MAPLLSRRGEARAMRLARSQPDSLGELNDLARELTARIAETVLRDALVRHRLAGARHRILAVDYREEKDEAGRVIRLADAAIYDYDRDLVVTASVDPRTGRVVDVVERAGVQPPVPDDERDEAIRLVPPGSEVGRALRRRRHDVVAFSVPSYAFDAEPERRGHRGCTLYVRVGRGRVLAATVDLSAQEPVPDERLPEGLRSPASRTASGQRATERVARASGRPRARPGSSRSKRGG